MEITYYDRIDYECSEPEFKQYVCFSKHLTEKHPEFVLVIDCDEVEKQELENILKNERIIIKQGINTKSEDIYKIYKKKIGKLYDYEDDYDNFVDNILKNNREQIDKYLNN